MNRSAGAAIGFAFVLAVGAVPGCDCNNSGMNMMDQGMPDLAPFDQGTDDSAADGLIGITDAGPICGGAGSACANDGECCSNLCDPTSHVCGLPKWLTASAACASAADYCVL